MAIIYSYPETTQILLTDMLIGTSTIRVAGKKKNLTKNFTIETLGGFIHDNFPTQWGEITGTLSTQTDLQAALDSKQGNITLTTIGTSGTSTLIGDILNIPNYTMAVPTKTSDLINDGEDGIHPFITAEDIPPSASTLNDVLTNGNTSLLDAKIGTLGLWDVNNSYYNKLLTQGNAFAYQLNSGENIFVVNGSSMNLSNGIYALEILHVGITATRTLYWPDASGTIALTTDIPSALTFTSPLVDTLGTITIDQSNTTTDGYLSSTDWNTFNGKQDTITLTTTGTSGAATFIANALNIPNYSTDLSGYVPYIGATSDVDLGLNNLYTNKLYLFDEAEGESGSIHYADEALHFSNSEDEPLLWVEFGFMQIHKDATIQSNLFTSNLTATRDHYLPDSSGTIALTSDIPSPITPAALTKTNDTNVTLTLGGSPTNSLLQATSLTLGWTGTLADSRIASAATWNAKQNALTNPITGTGTIGTIPKFNGSTTSLADSTIIQLANGDVTINGVRSGKGNNTLSDNTVFGVDAGKVITTGQYNSLFGFNAGISLTSGEANVFIGRMAGNNNSTGKNNTFIGLNAGYGNTTLSDAVSVGYAAGYGTDCTFVGSNAGRNQSGSYNSYFGKAAGQIANANSYNSYFGNASGENSTSTQNSFFGHGTGNVTTGANNTFLGTSAGQVNTSGNNNVYIGKAAGFSTSTSTSNALSTTSVLIGVDTKTLASGDTNEIVIGYNATGIGSNSVVLGNDSITKTALKGNVGIGTTSPTEKLHVSGNIKIDGTYNALYSSNVGAGDSAAYFIGTSAGTYQSISIKGGTTVLANKTLLLGQYDNGDALIYNQSDAAIILSTNSTERMRITNAGKVGIGTTAPTSKLQVVGLVEYATNALAIAGGLTVGAFYHTAGVVKVVI